MSQRAVVDTVRTACARVAAEIRLTVELLRHNFPAFAVGLLFVLLSTPVSEVSGLVWLEITIFILVYAYVFELENQISGIAEDQLNKRTRPLPSGRMTVEGAHTRRRIGRVLHLLSGAWTIILVWPLLSMLLLHVYHHGVQWKRVAIAPWSRRAWTKQLFAVLAAAPKMLGVCEIAGVRWWQSPETWGAFLVACVAYWFLLGHIQDLRDVEGDREMSRATLPWHLGEARARKVLAAGMSIWGLGWLSFVVISGQAFLSWWLLVPCAAAFAVVPGVIVQRLIRHPSGATHQVTYHLYVFYYFLMVAFLVWRAQSAMG